MKITEQLPWLGQINRVLVLFFLISAATNAQQTGFLSVSVDPDVEIFIDSTLVANRSFTNLAMKTGTYELLIMDINDFSWNKRAIRETVQILADHEIVRNYKSDNFRKILSQPVGAEVYLGSIMLGRTPLTVKKELLEDQSVTLRKTGFMDKSFSIDQIDNQKYLIMNKSNPEDNPAVFEAALGGTRVNWFRESLVLTSFLSSWGAFMFKRQADQNYARYLTASYPPLMQQYYDQAQKYDRYSEVAIGVSITALSIYMILLITE